MKPTGKFTLTTTHPITDGLTSSDPVLDTSSTKYHVLAYVENAADRTTAVDTVLTIWVKDITHDEWWKVNEVTLTSGPPRVVSLGLIPYSSKLYIQNAAAGTGVKVAIQHIDSEPTIAAAVEEAPLM